MSPCSKIINSCCRNGAYFTFWCSCIKRLIAQLSSLIHMISRTRVWHTRHRLMDGISKLSLNQLYIQKTSSLRQIERDTHTHTSTAISSTDWNEIDNSTEWTDTETKFLHRLRLTSIKRMLTLKFLLNSLSSWIVSEMAQYHSHVMKNSQTLRVN